MITNVLMPVMDKGNTERSKHTNSLILLGGKSVATHDMLIEYSLQAEKEEDGGLTLVGCRRLWNHRAQRQQNSAGQEM